MSERLDYAYLVAEDEPITGANNDAPPAVGAKIATILRSIL